MSNAGIPRHQRPTKLKKFLFGAPYYPEHWTEAERAKDPERMASAGVNVVRMAEFAWDRIEPRRGQFDFSLFDETIARLGKLGIDTILCTPTATPPRWLTVGHDDWMRVDADGRRMQHGNRQHVCTTNEEFRAESRRITNAMAAHYARNPHVIGWQTDNELYCHFSECFCPSCEKAFREWLRAKYRTAAALNAAWGTAFWAQTYDDFEQVPLPRDNRPASSNPSHELDYFRFLSDMVVEFQRQQVHILREANPAWFVTHNGLFAHVDCWKFTEDLDFLGVDVYPCFGTMQPSDAPRWAFWEETCRAVSGGFIVPEQQAGPGGQKAYILPTPQPGQMRLWAWQSIAHGADGVLHFRWRTCRFGREEYWVGVLDHDDVPRRRYDEFAREGSELKRIGGRILGTVLEVQAGVLIERDQDEAYATMPLDAPSPQAQAGEAYAEMWRRHLPCGLIHTADSFDGLRLLVLPSMPLMDEVLADKLRAFVEGGGVLLVTARSPMRDRNNQVFAETPPALLSELCGLTIEEFGRLEPGTKTLSLGETLLPSGAGYGILSPHDAEVAAVWNPPADGSPHAASGRPAACLRRVGRGVVLTLGTFLTPQNVGPILALALSHVSVSPLAAADEYVEVTCRRTADRRLTFVLNHYPQPRKVSGLPTGRELLGDVPCSGSLELKAWDVAIVETKSPRPAAGDV